MRRIGEALGVFAIGFLVFVCGAAYERVTYEKKHQVEQGEA